MFARAAALSGLFVVSAIAMAGPQDYAQKTVNIRAGVVQIESQGVSNVVTIPGNPTPFVWYYLDSDRLGKPAGWTFSNPRASTQVTQPILDRWTAISTVVGGNPPKLGDLITKSKAAYWEVPLGTSSASLLGTYDVLYLPMYGNIGLNPFEREKLRGFVDHGGVLWIDVSNTATIDPINLGPLAFANATTALGGALFADDFHPLLSYPNSITVPELQLLETDGTLSAALQPVDLNAAGAGALASILAPLREESLRYQPVAADLTGATLAVAKLGDGYIVTTFRGAARALNQVRYDPQSGALLDNNNRYDALPPIYLKSQRVAAKLLVNAISLNSSSAQTAQGSGKQNGSAIDLGAPLIKRFDDNAIGAISTSPATYKGLLVVTTATQVLVYNANPGKDLDHHGDPDQGIPDYDSGTGSDLIWASQPMTGPLSSPACMEVPDANGTPKDQILVVDGAGNLQAFNALPLDAQGHFPTNLTNAAPAYTVAAPNGGSDNPNPFSPTIHDGLVFISDFKASGFGTNNGRVWIADPVHGKILTSAADWYVGGSSNVFLGQITASPTVGDIPVLDNSGGVDEVIYVPTDGKPSIPVGIFSLWLGVKGEKPSAYVVQGNQLEVTTRASLQGLSIYNPGGFNPLGIRISLIRANGSPYTGPQLNTVFTGAVSEAGGILTFDMKGNALPNDVTGVRLDYTIDWGTGNPQTQNQIIRGSINFQDNANNTRDVQGNLALSPQGTLYAVVSAAADPNYGGSFYALREEGRGSFRMLTRYELYKSYTMTLSQSQVITQREAVIDEDGLLNMVPFLRTPFTRIAFQSGPSVRNGVVYVLARGYKAKVAPCTILMAFAAEPETPEVAVGNLGDNFTVIQPDLARSVNMGSNPAQPEAFSALPSQNLTYEADRGIIRFDNLMGGNRGPVQSAISLSQPIIIRRPSQPDLFIQPDTVKGSRWNPLLWYAVFHGLDSQVAPVTTGGTLFVAGNSVFPNILAGNRLIPTGRLQGINADIPANDPFTFANSVRPWMLQVNTLTVNGGNVAANPNMRWPQATGVTSFNDWVVRYLQTTLIGNPNKGAPLATGLVAGDGALFAASDQGVYGFSKGDFIIADEGRLGRFDASGNAIWTTDASLNTGSVDSGGAGNVRPLVRPTKGYQIGENDFIAVDTGSSRLVELDNLGREIRSIDGFRLDANNQPDGYVANESKKLDSPRDVLVFNTYESNPAGVTNPQPQELWVHYLIADTGNKRLLELIDRYQLDPATHDVIDAVAVSGVRQLGVLLWHSPSSMTGNKFDYHSVARVFVPTNPNNNAIGRFVIAAGIGSVKPTRIDTGLDAPNSGGPVQSDGGSGGIVIFDGANSQVINEVSLPSIGINTFYDQQTGLFDLPVKPTPERILQLGALNSVTMRNVLVGGQNNTFLSQVAIMFTDASGAYEIVPDPATNYKTWVVRWMMTPDMYKVLRRTPTGGFPDGVPSGRNPQGLVPTYAKRLASGEVVLVNGYFGRTRSNNPFAGEVIQLDGDISNGPGTGGFSFTAKDLGFNTLSVRFELPPVQGVRGLILPVFADRR